MSREPGAPVSDYESPAVELDFREASYRRVVNCYRGVDLVIPPVVSSNRRGSE